MEARITATELGAVDGQGVRFLYSHLAGGGFVSVAVIAGDPVVRDDVAQRIIEALTPAHGAGEDGTSPWETERADAVQQTRRRP